mgnify:CR=1 FL=1
MDWQQISFEVQKSEVDLISEVLMGLGSLSITCSDAQENDIYEPPVGTTPLWENVTVTALFSSEMSKDSIAKTILEICDVNISDALSLEHISRSNPRSVILHTSIQIIRKFIVNINMVKLTYRKVFDKPPGFTLVFGNI